MTRTAHAPTALLALALALGAPAVPSPLLAADDVIGVLPFGIHFTRFEDTFADIAVERDLGYTELVAANPHADPWLPGDGTLLLLPTAHVLPRAPRRGIVINVAEQRLYAFPRNAEPLTFPLGVGTDGVVIRTGETRVRAKRVNPTWVPTASVRAEVPELPPSVPPGPDNPLGPLAIDLDWPGIVVHGTNRPYGIGRRVSHGCFRLYNDDIRPLFDLVAVGTPVTVVDQPAKLGWSGGSLWLEVHPTLEQTAALEEHGRIPPAGQTGLDDLVLRAAGSMGAAIDWQQVRKAERERTGLPVRILHHDRDVGRPAPRG